MISRPIIGLLCLFYCPCLFAQAAQEQVQVQAELVTEQRQRATVLHKDLAKIRWRLIVLKFERLDKLAALHGWYLKSPPVGDPLHEKFLDWLYLVVHWEVLEAGLEPGTKAAVDFLRRKAVAESHRKPERETKRPDHKSAPLPVPSVAPQLRGHPEMLLELPKGYRPKWKK